LEAEYEVTNLTASEKYYDFKSSLEKSRGGLPQNQLLRMEVSPNEYVVEGDDLKKITQPEDPDNPYSIATIPVKIAGRGSQALSFKTTRQAYYHLNDAIVLDILEPPCIGIALELVGSLTDFEFRVSFGTEEKIRPSKVTPRSLHFDHPRVHLPGSHFRVQWEYRQNHPTTPGRA
jgi:hypothetical protein